MKKQIYIAAPFFTPDQIDRIEAIKKALGTLGLTYYSLSDDLHRIIDFKTQAIDSCAVLIAVIDGDDVGTIFACGYAYAKYIHVMYLLESRHGSQKINSMLSASGSVSYSIDELMLRLSQNKFFPG